MGEAGIERGVDILIGVGIGVFVLVIILALMYQGYGQTQNQQLNQLIQTTGCQTTNSIAPNYCYNNGQWLNFTHSAGGITNTFGSNLGLAIFVLVMAVIILVIILALKNRNGGGFLGG